MENLSESDGGYDAVVVGSGYGGSVAACRLSMARLKVCVLEKGRRYEGKDFPTDNIKMTAAVRMEFKKFGFNFGRKDALLQLHINEDSLAAVVFGLGGGSLINCGVIIPTPARVRRDPRWPKIWETDWDRYEATASDMLRAQTLPVKFQSSKMMDAAVDEDFVETPIQLSMNVGNGTGNCIACGNCLSGCPYNAKNSVDQSYLVAALQEGCTIRTGCDVQYVVRNVEKGGKSKQRQWLVFLNECDYIETDVVVLSAGVLGTAKILFQSQMRGLTVSDKLGSRVSCNGNNIGYLVGSGAPLNAQGLHKNQVSNVPIQERPGPSISSSYTSSLGFSIQPAIIPIAYPCFLVKGWNSTFSLFYTIIQKVLGLKSGNEMALNIIGPDESNGKLTYDKHKNRVLLEPPQDHLLPKKIEAINKLAKKLGGVLYMSPFRSTAVHLLGGCVASNDALSGVCNPQGQVFDAKTEDSVHSGLYICDASIIPCAIGVNPCLAITAAAEHVSRHIVKDAVKYVERFENGYSVKKFGIIEDVKVKGRMSWEVKTSETMRGEVGWMPCTAYLILRFRPSHDYLRGDVGGYVECQALESGKLYVIRGEVDLCKTDVRTPYTQYMYYHLILAGSSGSRFVLEGRKIMNPYLLGLYAWRESTTMNVSLKKVSDNNNMELKGNLHISPLEVVKSVCSFEGRGTGKFIYLLLQSLIRTYILQLPRGRHLVPDLVYEPYPDSTIYEIVTEDNFRVSCKHWKSSYKIEEQKPYPVLLLNGYATESYCLPTEQNDVVRTLLRKGHDVWLLYTRMHWSNPANDFSVEDIGRLDIPAAIRKIIEFYGTHVRVHAVAHCLGGVSMHIALMGGHGSAKHIASLSCTNSSMFFKVTTSSLVKMWLPLLPFSMAVLGENKILPMLEGSKASFRHRFVRTWAPLLIPRYERCSCYECELFSSFFGNAFWHENISQSMHSWMNKQNLPRLPLAAFPHLTKICKAGFIVDANGNNSYLIHPERMAMPTLYISGGRTLLVTPETSFLASKYMKLHQPGYRHERVVVDGFGHSDLLIGVESHKKVIPHIENHIDLAEKERWDLLNPKPVDYGYAKESFAWSVDPYEDGEGYGRWVFSFIIILLLVIMVFMIFFFK